MGRAGPQGLCPGAGSHQIQVAPHVLATSTGLGSAVSCAGAQPGWDGGAWVLRQVSTGSFSKIPVLPARIQPCWGSFSSILPSSASVQGGMVREQAEGGGSRDARALQGVIPGGEQVHLRPATLGGDEGTGACSCAQGCLPVPSRGVPVPAAVARSGGTMRSRPRILRCLLPTCGAGEPGAGEPLPRSRQPLAAAGGAEPLGSPGSGRVSDRSSTWRREEPRAERGHAALTRVRGAQEP